MNERFFWSLFSALMTAEFDQFIWDEEHEDVEWVHRLWPDSGLPA